MINFSPRAKLFKGVETLEKAVATTLGARGCNVGIDEGFRKRILHDGVSVARMVSSKDQTEQFGISVVREAAEKTVKSVGDGTTVTIVLAKAIIEEALKQVAANVHPMSIRPKLEADLQTLLDQIQTYSITPTREQLEQVATISAEDPVLGKLVAQTVSEVGENGIVTVEESKSPDTIVEHQKGMMLDQGYASPYFVTNPNRMECVIENAYILITDMPIDSMSPLVPFLNEFLTKSRSLIVLAPDFTGEVLPSFAMNKVNGTMLCLCVKASLFGELQKEILQDIAVLTGATVVSKDAGMNFEDMKMEYLGKVDRVESTQDATLFIANGHEKDVEDRIEAIKTQIKDATEWRLSKFEERLAKLTNGVAVIKVGGATEIEMTERKERVEDAKEATIAARRGIVAGGETIYLKIREKLNKDSILYRALEKPFMKLVENAGMNGGQMLERLNNSLEDLPQAGINVLDGQVVDLLHEGIVDPTAVSTEALKNAVSVSIQIITTSVEISPDKEKK